MSSFCPARYESSSALEAAHVEKHLCSMDGHGPQPFSKGNSHYIHYWPVVWGLRLKNPEGLSLLLPASGGRVLGCDQNATFVWDAPSSLLKAEKLNEGARKRGRDYSGTGEGQIKARSSEGKNSP